MTSRELLESISVIIAVDGKLADEEKKYLLSVARQLGVSKDEVGQIFDKVREGRGVIATPRSIEDQVDLYAHLVKAAASDGAVSTKERRILNDIGERFGLGGALLKEGHLVETSIAREAQIEVVGTRSNAANVQKNPKSAWPHFFWAAAVTIIALGGMAAAIVYYTMGAAKDTGDKMGESITDGGARVYEDGKAGAKKAVETLAELMRTKETIIHSALVKAFNENAKLVVYTGEIEINSKGTKELPLWWDATVDVKVTGIKVQYFIPLSKRTKVEIKPDTGQLVLYIPKPALDRELVEVPDSSDPSKWEISQEGLFGSNELFEKLRASVRDVAIDYASRPDCARYEVAMEKGKPALRSLIEPVLDELVPGAKLEIEYEMPEVSAKKMESSNGQK